MFNLICLFKQHQIINHDITFFSISLRQWWKKHHIKKLKMTLLKHKKFTVRHFTNQSQKEYDWDMSPHTVDWFDNLIRFYSLNIPDVDQSTPYFPRITKELQHLILLRILYIEDFLIVCCCLRMLFPYTEGVSAHGGCTYLLLSYSSCLFAPHSLRKACKSMVNPPLFYTTTLYWLS